MRRLRLVGVSAGAIRPAGWLAVLGLAAALAGCATSSGNEPPGPSARLQRDSAEIEADGLPPQVAPSSSIRFAPDDPSEPYSRNYGARPPAGLSGPPSRMSPAEEEALIAAAITAHEMRRP
jgi:hypothetical protein